MKIAHLLSTFRFENGGPVRAVIDLSGALAAAGHDVTVFTWDDADIPDPWKRNAANTLPRVHRMSSPRFPGQFLSRTQLHSLADALRHHDVLHLHGVWEPVNVQVSRLARRLNLPYILSPRGMLDDYSVAQKRLKKQAYLALCGRQMLNRAARIHLASEGELKQSQARLPPGRGVVIPNLVDLAQYQNLPGPDAARLAFDLPEDGPPIVAFLGRLHSIKALDVLIRAAGRAREAGTDLRLVLAGPGDAEYTAYLTETAESVGMTDRLTFTGMVTGGLKLSLLQAADLFALPSHHENFGFALIEAMACGTPVLASRGVLIWPDVELSGAGFVADGNELALSRTLAQALGMPDLIKQMGRTARQWVVREFEVAGLVERFAQMYVQSRGRIHASSP